MEVPQPIMSVVLSFQHRLHGYMSGLSCALSRSTFVMHCFELIS